MKYQLMTLNNPFEEDDRPYNIFKDILEVMDEDGNFTLQDLLSRFVGTISVPYPMEEYYTGDYGLPILLEQGVIRALGESGNKKPGKELP